MRRLLLVLACLVLAAIIATAIFLATFDIDKYRPMLVSQMEEALKREVTLGRISLKWRGGLALDLQRLAVHDQAPGDTAPAGEPSFDTAQDGPPSRVEGEPLLQVDSASAVLRVLPLLRKEVQLASILLRRPQVHVARDPQGRVNLLGLIAAASPAGAGADPAASAGSGAQVAVNIASLQMIDGSVHWTDAMTAPPMELWLRQADVRVKNISPGRPMDFDVRGALAADTPNLFLSGRLTPPGPRTEGSIGQIVFTAEELPLAQILPPVPPNAPELRGQLTVRLQGALGTLNPAHALASLSGSGSFRISDPVVVNLNILRVVFERFSVLPGLSQALESRLPGQYQEMLQANDTKFSPIDLPLQVERGVLRFKSIALRTEMFSVSGVGHVGFDRALAIQAALRMEPSLSTAVVRAVNELQALVSEDGEMEIPLAIQGRVPQITVQPDVNYIASKVISAKAGDLLGDLLKRALPQDAAQPAQPTEAGRAPAEPAAEEPVNPFAEFLKRSLQPAPADAPPSEAR